MTFTEIEAYCALTGIFAEEERRDLIYFLQELDVRYLKHAHEMISKGRDDARRKAEREADKRRRR